MPDCSSETILYVYVDEAGNFDFSSNGSKFFILTCVTLSRPFPAHERLLQVKYDLLESGSDIERFHATEDRQCVRDKVFGAITERLDAYRAYAVVLRKSNMDPSLRDPVRLYPAAFAWLMKFVLPRRCGQSVRTAVVITDRLPVKRKRRAVEKAVKSALAPWVPAGVRYFLYHHESKADLNLQIADYFGWAIQRKWEKEDERSYELVRPAIVAEGDLFGCSGAEYH